MFSTRDQENLVHGHQQVAASKPLNQSTRSLQPKTPGNKYPKTPLKIPLHDENAPAGFGGKSVKGKGLENLATGKKATFNKDDFVTPMGPRTRAPLGMKTTNAKAKAFQTPAGPAEKEAEKAQAPQTSARRLKKVTHAETSKIQVHGDESPLVEREVEYCPPKPKELPFETEDFPDGCLDYTALKPGNLMRGLHQTYYNKVDANGMTRQDRELEASYQRSIKKADEQTMKMMEEDWTIGDVPETFRNLKKKQPVDKDNAKLAPRNAPLSTKGPATIASRKAASALSVVPKSTVVPPKTTKPKPATSFLSRPKLSLPATNNNPMAAEVASRSTIGYTKGRNASTALKKKEGGFTRSVSNVSHSSDTTITPARFAEKEGGPGSEEWRRLKFLGAFDVDHEDLEPGLRGALPECLRGVDENDEEFVMTLGSS
ncbi:hypothetical protein D0Z07_8993 [Hyphodiscus hymeniophilus]|uniref:Uncharacterized protein n=1 Tax=Hyphodiscus hymeniophilus TaxID=353542 RepID=A0A9P6VDP5_9HELO|nr:hypothetical protein D0Z07_8993 [Hyphodiscus hymeniophilus]